MKIKKLIIILGCCIITLFSLVFVGCKTDTAKASTITSDVPLIELPAIPLNNINQYDGGYIPSIYIGASNGNFIFYYAIPNDTLANFDYNVPTLLPPNTPVTFSPNYVYQDLNKTISILPMHIGGGATITISDVSYEYLSQTCAYIGFEYINSTITYYFFNSNRNVIANVTLNNIHILDTIAVADYDYFLFTTISSSANTTDLVNNAYRQGYDVGYNDGFNQGVSDGTPLGFVSSAVNSLLDIRLFGDFKIATIFYIVFGMILVGIVIKVFLGG